MLTGSRVGTSRLRARPARTYLQVALPVLLGIALAFAAVEYAKPVTRHVGPFQVEMEARLASRGETTMAFPPFGEVSAATHPRVPLAVRFVLTGVDLTTLRNWVEETSSAHEAWIIAREALRPLAGAFLLRTMLVAAVLGGSGAYLVSRGWRATAAGAVTAVLTVAALALGVVADFDREAFRRPRYQGALEAAPWAVGLLEKNWERMDELGNHLEALAENLSTLSDQLGGFATVAQPPSDLRLLHVSDLHNNPVGVKFIAEVVRAFKVDAVVDTGDLTDWGTPIEADLVRGIAGLRVPYFVVPGNHDSPDLQRELRRYPQVKVLDGRPAMLGGLVILGIADPSAERNDPEPAPQEELRERGRALARAIEEMASPPDVVAVHNGAIGRELRGKVPVVLYGHDHRLSVLEEGGTTFIDAGTTGAAGVRGLQARKELPLSMVLLYFSRTKDGYRLRALDTLEVRGRSAGFSLNRILVGDEGNPSTAGEPSTSGPGA